MRAKNLRDRTLQVLTSVFCARPSFSYVSTDVEESAMKSVLAQKPWLRMVRPCHTTYRKESVGANDRLASFFGLQTFHDGSDFAPMAKSAPAAVTELLRGEEFVTAGEIENGQYDLPTEGYADPLVRPARAVLGTFLGRALTDSLPFLRQEYEYARPLSRAGLTAYFGALRTPTITI